MTQVPPSLARLLVRRLVAVFALAFAGSCVVFLILARWDPTIAVEESIGDLAQELALAVRPGPDGKLALQPGKSLADNIADESVRYLAVERATGRVLAQSRRPLAEFAPALPASGARRMAFSIVTPAEYPTLRLDGFVVERDTPAGAVLAAVAVERTHFWHFIAWIWEELVEDVLPVGIPLVFVTLIVTAITIRRTLRPVANLSRQAAAITPRTTGLRLDAANVPGEVLSLVTAFNAALDRLDQGFTMQRRFTANAAHQLRTPLAILRARLDGMGAGAETAALKRDCDRITRVVAQLLAIARLDAREIEIAETVDLCALARETVSTLAPLAIAQGRSLSLDAGTVPAAVRGNSAALGDALGNLIENALRFTPPGGAVKVAVRPGVLAVLDRGPGVKPEERTRVFEPFWRGSDPRGPGSGLGLAIVAEIAAAHGGRVSVLDRAGGGAEFRIDLPHVATPAQALAAQ